MKENVLLRIAIQLPVWIECLSRAILNQDYESEANIRLNIYERYGTYAAAFDGIAFGNN